MAMRKKIMGTLILATAAGAIVLQVEDSGTVPAAPSGLSAVAISASRIDLAWTDNAGNETGFAVERAPDVSGNPGTFAEIATTAANTASYSNTGLAAETAYHYRVKATSETGSSGYSDTATATTEAVGEITVPTADSFTFSGWYTYGQNLATGMAFSGPVTIRYVGGERRFLATAYNNGSNDTIEFRLPAGAADGRAITAAQKTRTWPGASVWPTGLQGHHHGIWWEDLGGGTGRLWGSQGIDYGSTAGEKGITRAVTVRTLNDDLTVSNYKGPYGFEGVSQRCVMGRVLKNPQWFQDQYGVGPYAFGSGGYASLQIAGGLVSLGFFLVTGPDVSIYSTDGDIPYRTGSATDWNIPVADFDILSDHRSGLGHATNDTQSPPRWDRGYQLSPVENWFDGVTNPDVPANGTVSDAEMREYYDTNTPGPGSNWQLPEDGIYRWPWGTSPFASACWIDGTSKKGLVYVLHTTTGWTGYVNSTLGGEAGAAEIHVIDPAQLGEVKAGTREPWNVQPVAMKDITALIGSLGIHLQSFGNESNGVVGAEFDPVDNTLWITVIGTGLPDGYGCALLRFDVDC